MSPRTSSTAASQRNNSAPYSRRPAIQPKSSRQQFSACGACRMRRVRCDLKDLPYTPSSPHPSCSNCKERGLKCVDEFAEVKAVKLLRRGRRLQQVEAIYGKAQNATSSFDTRLPSAIPQLAPEFFSSPFWKWFAVQRPILDPVEFPARFIAHTKGVHSLGNEGGLLAMVLVVWAASFGLDEYGSPDMPDADHPPPSSQEEPSLSFTADSPRNDVSPDPNGKEPRSNRRIRRKDKADAMLREVLELVDFHGIMRRPTWDGVRVLLLILPLLEEAHPLEKVAIYEAAISQAQALSTLSGPTPSSQLDSDGAFVRAQIFWYAHTHEGITTAIRGGRLVLDGDDLDMFQSTMPPYGSNGSIHSHSALSPIRPISTHGITSAKSQRGPTAQAFLHLSQLFSLPLQLGAICRNVNTVLTGAKAVKRVEEHGLVDANGMREIWEDLDRCWKEFDLMRRNGSDTFDVEQYVGAWQIFIFECHNMIRESLKQHMCSPANNTQMPHSASSRPSSGTSSSPYLSPHYLHVMAMRKCLSLLPLVLRIIKFHLSEETGRGLFKWDTGIVREGCFFAGYLAANVEGETIDCPPDARDEELGRGRGSWRVEECVNLCLTALAEMRWSFSKSEEREETIRMVWDNKRAGHNSHRYLLNVPGRFVSDGYPPELRPMSRPMTMGSVQGVSNLSGSDRPLLPPLHLLYSPRRAESAPNTGYTTTGHGSNGWPSYTPPRTGTSIATSTGTGVSRGSPEYSLALPAVPFKTDPNDSYYDLHQDLDQFSFNVPVPSPALGDEGIHYHHREPPSTAHSIRSAATSTYLDSSAYAPQGPSMMNNTNDGQDCSRFGDDHGFYP